MTVEHVCLLGRIQGVKNESFRALASYPILSPGEFHQFLAVAIMAYCCCASDLLAYNLAVKATLHPEQWTCVCVRPMVPFQELSAEQGAFASGSTQLATALAERRITTTWILSLSKLTCPCQCGRD